MNVMPGAYGCRRAKKYAYAGERLNFACARAQFAICAPTEESRPMSAAARAALAASCARYAASTAGAVDGNTRPTARLELADRRDGAERAERLVAREADHDRHVAVLLRLERLLRADARSGRRRRSAHAHGRGDDPIAADVAQILDRARAQRLLQRESRGFALLERDGSSSARRTGCRSCRRPS